MKSFLLRKWHEFMAKSDETIWLTVILSVLCAVCAILVTFGLGNNPVVFFLLAVFYGALAAVLFFVTPKVPSPPPF
ncbi:MAG: hypothetical protein WC310_02845 [Patescibacteria group bacterium]|jgi:membrane protein YdbS with pleckstrin-like domain